jgi:hypothetical protein
MHATQATQTEGPRTVADATREHAEREGAWVSWSRAAGISRATQARIVRTEAESPVGS